MTLYTLDLIAPIVLCAAVIRWWPQRDPAIRHSGKGLACLGTLSLWLALNAFVLLSLANAICWLGMALFWFRAATRKPRQRTGTPPIPQDLGKHWRDDVRWEWRWPR